MLSMLLQSMKFSSNAAHCCTESTLAENIYAWRADFVQPGAFFF
jgi:hypothetical protein